jgi:hypothetical protein
LEASLGAQTVSAALRSPLAALGFFLTLAVACRFGADYEALDTATRAAWQKSVQGISNPEGDPGRASRLSSPHFLAPRSRHPFWSTCGLREDDLQ